MPFTFNGIGTKYYGNRDVGPDGSFITTEWITFVYIPLLPIRSLRVQETGKSTTAIVYNSRGYLTQSVPLCWKQIRNVYIFLAVIAAVIAICIGLSS